MSSSFARQSFFFSRAPSWACICDQKPSSWGRFYLRRRRYALTAWSRRSRSSSLKEGSLSVTCLRWVTVSPTTLRNYRFMTIIHYIKHWSQNRPNHHLLNNNIHSPILTLLPQSYANPHFPLQPMCRTIQQCRLS